MMLSQQTTAIGLHPLYLMLPSTIAASYTFMLPTATSANALAYSYGYLRVIDMVGILRNKAPATAKIRKKTASVNHDTALVVHKPRRWLSYYQFCSIFGIV